MADRRLGKHAAQPDRRVPPLDSVMRADEPPDACNWHAAVSEWPMLGNDTVGDCVPAGALHCIQQRAAYADRPVMPTTADAVALYERWAGYRPGDPATDHGTLMATAMADWAAHAPVLDHALEAYAQVEHVSTTWIRRAIWRCGGVLLGLQCPEAWLSADYLLDLPNGFGEVAGGHALYLCGYQPTANGVEYDAITWGGRFCMTERALLAVADEAFAVLSRDWFDAAGHDPAGVAWTDAEAAMAAIRR